MSDTSAHRAVLRGHIEERHKGTSRKSTGIDRGGFEDTSTGIRWHIMQGCAAVMAYYARRDGKSRRGARAHRAGNQRNIENGLEEISRRDMRAHQDGIRGHIDRGGIRGFTEEGYEGTRRMNAWAQRRWAQDLV